MKRKRKVEETEESKKSCEKKRKRINLIISGMKRTEKTTLEATPKLDPNQLDDNTIALKRNGEGEMRASTVQQEKNIIKVWKLKNILKFFENRSEENIEKPLTYRKGILANTIR